jgi:hypothetical protein
MERQRQHKRGQHQQTLNRLIYAVIGTSAGTDVDNALELCSDRSRRTGEEQARVLDIENQTVRKMGY